MESPPTPTESTPSGRYSAGSLRDGGLALCLVLGAILNARAFQGYVFEDAYITFRYAQNLADGLGFTFNPGERVLGTSTPLFTLLLAFLGWLGVDIPTAGTWIYCFALAAAGGLGAWLLGRMGFPNAGALFALATVWGAGDVFAFSGMETTLHLALMLATFLAVAHRHTVAVGALLGLLCLNRYDGGVVAVVVGFYLWWVRGRPPWKEAAIASAIFGPWLVFAGLHFGTFLPNTLGAKAGDSGLGPYVVGTLDYLGRALARPVADPAWLALADGSLGWILPCVLVLPVAWAGRRALVHPSVLGLGPAVVLGLWVGYGLIGPPIHHRWYHLPSVYLLLLAALACWGAWVGARGRSWPTAGAVVLVAATLLTLPWAADRRGEFYGHRPSQHKVEAYDHFIAWTIDHRLTNTSIATPEPGYLTFHTGQRAIDLAGLVTEGIYFHGPRERRSQRRAVLGQLKPDFVVDIHRGGMPGHALLEDFAPVVRWLSGGTAPSRTLLIRRDLHRQMGSPEAVVVASPAMGDAK